MEAVAYPQGKVFEAAIQFARTEGKIPAPETAHAVRASSTRHWPPRRRVRSGSSSSTTRATVTSISPPTTTSSTTG